MREFELAEKRLKLTNYLQFQLSKLRKEIEQISLKISLTKDIPGSEIELKQFKNILLYKKGKRDALQELWKFRNE